MRDPEQMLEVLRHWQDETLEDPSKQRAWYCGEAADAIEALQADRERDAATVQAYSEQCDKWQAEVERLRAVLDGFAEAGYSHDTYSAYKRHVRDAAREALREVVDGR